MANKMLGTEKQDKYIRSLVKRAGKTIEEFLTEWMPSDPYRRVDPKGASRMIDSLLVKKVRPAPWQNPMPERKPVVVRVKPRPEGFSTALKTIASRNLVTALQMSFQKDFPMGWMTPMADYLTCMARARETWEETAARIRGRAA